MSLPDEESLPEQDPLEAAYQHLEKIRTTPVAPSEAAPSGLTQEESLAAPDTVKASASTISGGQLRELFRMARQASSILDLHDLLETLLDLFIDMTSSQRGFIMLDWQAEKVEVGRNFSTEALRGNRLAMSRTVLQDVARTGTSVFVEDTLTQRAYGSRESIVALSLRSFYCVPMLHDGRVCGVCYTDSQKLGKPLAADDRAVLEEFAAQAAVAIVNARKHAALQTDRERLESENRELREIVAGRFGYDQIIGQSNAMQNVIETMKRIEASHATVLISGETGTGKELIARAVHARSLRKDAPLVSVNCGAIPHSLVESELFGYVRGAFTDARQDRLGRIASADGGTLFLDEVGELPLDVQVKLLRVLQEGELIPVGSDQPVTVDIRVIAATNRDLEESIEKGTFREDLFYRLHVIPLLVPPLRDRGTDALLLADEFLRRYAAENKKEIPGFEDQARRWMLQHRWPGNVRQLQNVIQRAVVLGEDRQALKVDLFTDYSKDAGTLPKPRGGTLRDVLDAVESVEVQRALAEVEGVVSRAAPLLGVSRQHLHNLIRKHGLKGTSSARRKK